MMTLLQLGHLFEQSMIWTQNKKLLEFVCTYITTSFKDFFQIKNDLSINCISIFIEIKYSSVCEKRMVILIKLYLPS